MEAETSPVNAPSLAQCRFCAAMAMFEPRAACAAAASPVKGGATTMSQCVAPAASGRKASKNARISAWVLYIFQLPAITGRRMGGFSAVGQSFHARQFSSAQEFDGSAAASGNVGDLRSQTALVHRSYRITAAHNGSGAARSGCGDGAGQAQGALVKLRQ